MITAIHDGTLQPRQKILSSRALAEKLDIARPEEILITLGAQKGFYPFVPTDQAGRFLRLGLSVLDKQTIATGLKMLGKVADNVALGKAGSIES